MEINKCLLKALLNDVFGILSIAEHPLSDAQDPPLVALDENVERTTASALGAGNKHHVLRFRQTRNRIVVLHPDEDHACHFLNLSPSEVGIRR
jgi:hypothetical protein